MLVRTILVAAVLAVSLSAGHAEQCASDQYWRRLVGFKEADSSFQIIGLSMQLDKVAGQAQDLQKRMKELEAENERLRAAVPADEKK